MEKNNRLTSKKAVIQKFNEGFKLETFKQFRREVYYLTNNKDREFPVSKSVIERMKLEGLIDGNNDYLRNQTNIQNK